MPTLLALAVLASHPQLTVYFQANLSDATYQRRAFDKVAKSFVPPKAAAAVGHKTVVQSVIAADGKLVSARVSMESGSAAWDAAALAAVQRAAPFPKLPADFSAPTVEAHFHFASGP